MFKTIVDWFNLIPYKFELFLFLLGALSVIIAFLSKKFPKLKIWVNWTHKAMAWLDEKLDYMPEWVDKNKELLSKYLSIEDTKNAIEIIDRLVHKIRIELEESGIVVTSKTEKEIAQKLIDLTPTNTEGVKLIKNKDGFEIKYNKNF